jgi:hypothetical protein
MEGRTAVTPTTQYLCPLACGWTHDQGVPDFNGAPGGTVEEVALTAFTRQAAADEIIVRAHLEAHTLLEWVTALRDARAERDRWQRQAEADGRRLGDLLDAVRERAEAAGASRETASVARAAADEECECGHYFISHLSTGRLGSKCHLCAVLRVGDPDHAFKAVRGPATSWIVNHAFEGAGGGACTASVAGTICGEPDGRHALVEGESEEQP